MTDIYIHPALIWFLIAFGVLCVMLLLWLVEGAINRNKRLERLEFRVREFERRP